jgi:hypothetical protein
MILTFSQAVVESSDYGFELYKSEGFQYLYHFETPVPEQFAGKPPQKFIWLKRDAKA